MGLIPEELCCRDDTTGGLGTQTRPCLFVECTGGGRDVNAGFACNIFQCDGFRYRMASIRLLVRVASTNGIAALETLVPPSTADSCAIR